MIDASLIDDFIPEAFDQLEILESSIIHLETRDQNEEVVSTLFRAAHTIKGSSEYIGLNRIATVAHKLENLLDMVRRKEILPDGELISLLINLHDCMADLVNDLLESKQEKTSIDRVVAETDDFCARAKAAGVGDHAGDASEQPMEDEEAEEAIEEDELLDFETSLSRELDEMPEDQPTDHTDENKDVPINADDRKALGRLREKGAYEEEYDEELFKIFIDHLEENMDHLLGVLSKGKEKKPKEILLQCFNIVTSLRSSAAYMDYGELVSFYDAWSSQIAAVSNIADKEGVSFAFITDYMDQIISHFSLHDRFHTISELAATQGESPDEKVPPEDEALTSETVAASDGMEMDESVEEEFEADPPGEYGDMEILDDANDEINSGFETAGLFDELDMVFDTSGQKKTPEILNIDPFEDDIEDELSALPTSSGPTKKTPPTMGKAFEKTNGISTTTTAGPPSAKPEEKKFLKQPQDEAPAQQSHKPTAEKPIQVEEKAMAPKPEISDGAALIESEDKTRTERPAQPMDQTATPEPAQTALGKERLEIPSEDQTGKIIYDDHSGARASKQTLRVAADKIDKLMNQVGELVVNRASYAQLYNEMRDFHRQIRNLGLDAKESKWIRDFTFRLSEATVAMGRVANDLQEGVMKIRMLPISQLFNRYPRLVRDLVHNTGKQVQLEIHGEETELDKMVIEEIADPLVHIIRNAVDHGIETVAERQRNGKPPTATVRLESFHESNHVVIEIIDDGRGIDPQLIRNVAVEKGLFTREEVERMRPKEMMAVIMMPGFSTSEMVTTTSGRGVGMDVVKKNVEKLNGTIEIDSEVGEGTRIRIKIPLTLAIIQALLVKIGGEVFTIPLSVIEETLRVSVNDINTIEGIEVIQLREGVLSLLRLTDEFRKKPQTKEPGYEYVVVVNTGMRQVGLVVDSLIGQEEAVIKPLVDFLQERSGFSGATILGDGSVSLILDVYELVNICMERQASSKHAGEGMMSFSGPSSKKTGRDSNETTLH